MCAQSRRGRQAAPARARAPRNAPPRWASRCCRGTRVRCAGARLLRRLAATRRRLPPASSRSREPDPAAGRGDRGLPATGGEPLLLGHVERYLGSHGRERLGTGRQHGEPGAAVHHELLTRSGRQHRVAERDHHGHAERPGDDRVVRCGRSLRERDPEDKPALDAEIEQLRGPELARDHDRRPRRRLGGAGARQRADRPPPQLAHVRGTGREQRIAERRERVRMPLGRDPQGLRGGKVGRERLDLAVKTWIIGHEPVRGRISASAAWPSSTSRCSVRSSSADTRASASSAASAPPPVASAGSAGDVHGPDRDARGDDEAGEPTLGHRSAATACSRARRIATVEVAPGS